MIESIKLFHEIYTMTNNLPISANIFLVYTGNRNGCIIEEEEYKTREMYDILYDFLCKYFIVYVNNNNERVIPLNSLLVLINSNENIKKISDIINEMDVGKLISYPCPNDNFDYENRKYTYCVCITRNNIEHNLLQVICKVNKDKIFKKMVNKFQESLNTLNFDLFVKFHRNRVGNNNTINNIINKLKKNINVKNKFEKETILSYFDSKHLIFIVYCEEQLKLNIYKYKTMLLTLLTYCKYIPVFIPIVDENDEEYMKYILDKYNRIFIYQLEIIKIFMNFEFEDDIINKITTDYLINGNVIEKNVGFKINYKI